MILPLFLCFIPPLVVTQQTAEYYNDIWQENIQQLYTSRSQFPTRNEEFENYNPNVRSYRETPWEYVIVGAGSSGATLATRLALGGKSVLLLEAGGDESDFSLIPAATIALQISKASWKYRTTSQQHACFGCYDRKCDVTRPKILGGASATNAMLFVKGNRRDFDRWEEMGNDGWSYENVEQYFMKLENATALNLPSTTGRGLEGPYAIEYNMPRPWNTDAFIDGFKEMGYNELDYNFEMDTKTVAQMQVNTRFGRRESTNQMYLKGLCKNCETLKIQTNALATKIIFQNNTATGVTFIHNGQLYQADASEEVIISAGAVNTPQLLMLSGIGPEEELREKQIEPKRNLPAVGKNLDDHLTVYNIPIDTNVSLPKQTLLEIFEDYARGSGLASYTVGQQVAFIYFNGGDVPDIEYFSLQSNQMVRPEWIMLQSNYAPVMRDVTYSVSNTTILNQIVLLHAKSRGEVTLRSNNPIDFPDVNTNYLSATEDMDMLYRGIKELLNILDTEAMRRIGGRLGKIPIKPCDELKHDDRLYWECVIRHKSTGIYHLASTARMGKDESDSVVDNKLMVHGFCNLRVVDISTIPTQTSGHLNAVAIMIGEKTADEILNNRQRLC